MAGSLSSGSSTGRHRVFVLVDKGIARGVFFSWDAAETFADENRLSLDQLMEYETKADHPDHLHLLDASWEDDEWEFQGEWSRQSPRWPTPPKKVRLDHYHAKGDAFHLLRQKEFAWEDGLLARINPMAPDTALKQPVATPEGGTQKPKWSPKLTPLKPLQQRPSEANTAKEEAPVSPDTAPAQPAAEKQPLLPAEGSPKIPDFPKPVPPKKPKLTTSGKKPQPTPPDRGEAAANKPSQPEPKIAFQKKKGLKLKTKAEPQPIPSFKPTVAPVDESVAGKSSVELAQAQHDREKQIEEEQRLADIKIRKVWSIRLILSVASIVIFWTAGTFWALRPEPTAANILLEVSSLNSARLKVMEPEMVFFQLDVDPSHQERWIQSLKLQPLEAGRVLRLPTYHALDTWEKPSGYVRPPYSDTEVQEWWNLRLSEIRYGFVHRWEDGSILILDLESDTLIGWSRARHLPELLN